jgi:hypothetical protein
VSIINVAVQVNRWLPFRERGYLPISLRVQLCNASIAKRWI